MLIRIVLEEDYTHLYIQGNIDEDAAEKFLSIKLGCSEKIIVNWRGVTGVTSSGLHAWLDFFRGFREAHTVEFEECSPTIVTQFNMVPNFYEGAEIKSVIGEMHCQRCQTGELREIQVDSDGRLEEADDSRCGYCGHEMELEEEESYHFLQESLVGCY